MAAATPSRPSICVIPSVEIVSLAEELQGLGGNDVALAEATSVSLKDGAASEVSSSWINNGFNATLAPLNGADALQMEQLAMLMMSLGSRLAATNRLAFISVAVGQIKAVDALGRLVSPITGLKSAAAVEISSSTDLQELLQVALPQTEHVQDRIIALHAFSPSASTLSTFAAIINSSLSSNPSSSGSSSISHQAPTLALIEEVAQLHVLGRPGEHILRSAQLSLFNQIAAPLVGGNARLFLAIDEHSMGSSFLEKMASIKSVCSKVVLPASELRWVSMAAWQSAWQSAAAKQQEKEESKKKKGARVAVISTLHQIAHPTQSISTASSQQYVERRRQHRLRASMSLQLAASRLAINKAASGSSSPIPQAAADSSDVSIDQSSPTSKHPCQLRVEVPEGPAESQEGRRSDAESVEDFAAAPATVVVAVEESSAQPPISPASVSRSESGSHILDEDAFKAARRNIRESTRSLPVNRALSDLTSPSGAVQYGSTGSYSAAYNVGRGGNGGSVLEQATSGGGGGGGYSPQLGNAAGGSSFSAPRTSDVFSFDQPPSSMAAEFQSPAMNCPKICIQDDDEELCVDVSLQPREEEHYASPYGSDGHAGENAWVDKEEEEDCNDNLRDVDEEQGRYMQDYGAPRSLSFISSIPASTATLQKELEQERRVNAVLLRQLQDAEKRAAEATARAAVAMSLARAHEKAIDMAPITDPSDFQGMLGALHAERRQSSVLKEDILSAEGAKLSAQIELASMQRELFVAKACCRALQRQSSLAAAFAECEQELVAAQQESTAFKKENAELALKVANTEVDTLLAGSLKNNNKSTLQSEDSSSCIMADMHRRLTTAAGVTKRLREELAAKEEALQQVKNRVRSSEVSKRTAEDAMRRNQQLREQLEWTESELRAHCLAAAEAAALAEEIERSRQETEQELQSSRELCQQLDDVCDALRRQIDLLKGGGGLHSRALRCLGDGNPVNRTPRALPSPAC